MANTLTLYSIDTHFDASTTDDLENIVGKGEIARNKQFLLFLPNQITVSPFVHIFDIISLFTVELEEPKIGISGKGLTLYHTMLTLNNPKNGAFEHIMEKGKKCWKPAFSPFPKLFSILSETNLDKSRILSFGKESMFSLKTRN